MLKVALIGSVQFSHSALQAVLGVSGVEVVGVVTRNRSDINADFMSLEPLARGASIPVLLVEGNDQGPMRDFLEKVQPDVIYCFGWSYLLRDEILSIPPLGVIGFHPTALPQNRGRHPLIWALALGLRETASTFFRMDGGADSGPIINQVPVAIEGDDDAQSLYDKVTAVAVKQIENFTAQFCAGTIKALPQDGKHANVWRKRGERDGLIDWRMTSDAIHNLVRALSKPYVGAHCQWDGRNIKVWSAKQGPEAEPNIEPGKVLDVDGGCILVKCWGGSIWIVEHDFNEFPEVGDYL